MDMAQNAEIHTLAAPYALHALPEHEAIRFEGHLAACSTCRVEVDEIREAATRLGDAVEVTPPAVLKERVLTGIGAIRPLPPVVGTEAGDASQLAPWRRWWPRLVLGAAAALAAVVVVLGFQVADVRDDLATSRAAGAQMHALVTAPDFEAVQSSAGESTGTVLMARSRDLAMIVAAGMEPAPKGYVYQLWFVENGQMRSAGVLGVTHDGTLGPFSAHGLGNAGQVGITVEPDGGSIHPTTEPLMMIDLSHA
jgi:anti-sigma-K factor RskA